MLKRLHHGCSQFSEQLDIIDCICNYVLMEKTVFFQCLKFTFMMYKFSGKIFSLTVPREYL